MKRNIKRTTRILALAAAVALTATACSSKTTDAGSEGDLLTGEGISGDTITLGLMGDETGPFAALTQEEYHGVETYWDQANENGGVCEQFTVEFENRDHAYEVQQAVSLYNQLTPSVLAYQVFVGGSHSAAVLENAETDNRLLVPSSATEHLANSDVVLTPAMFYNLDMELVLEYMLEEGIIAEGDTIGMVYLEGDYGENAHIGAQAAAERHNLTLVDAMVTPSDADMTPHVNAAMAQDATAFLIGSVPGHTSSVATVLESANADIAMGGSWPSYSASLLQNTGGDYLAEHFYAGTMATTLEEGKGQEILELYQQNNDGEPETNQVAMGYGIAGMMHQILERACENGDLTPAGVVAAKNELGSIEVEGVMPEMFYDNLGHSPTREAYIVQLDPEVPGGLRMVSDGLYSSDNLSGN